MEVLSRFEVKIIRDRGVVKIMTSGQNGQKMFGYMRPM